MAGGWSGSSYTASTELMVDGASSWAEAGALPRPMGNLKAVSLDNQVISTGRHTSNIQHIYVMCKPHSGGQYRQDDGINVHGGILKFDTTSLSWAQVGELQRARSYHAVSVVWGAEVEQLCSTSNQTEYILL